MSSASPSPALVAVVEDDEPVLNSLEFALTAEGYRVQAFKTAQAALDSARIADADCLIVDYGLPDFDGMTLLRLLRARGIAAPAMIIASSPSAKCLREIEQAGVPLVEKPLTGDALGRQLRAALGRDDSLLD